MPNAPLASAPGKELHPPILSMLAMQVEQVNRERDIYIDIDRYTSINNIFYLREPSSNFNFKLPWHIYINTHACILSYLYPKIYITIFMSMLPFYFPVLFLSFKFYR